MTKVTSTKNEQKKKFNKNWVHDHINDPYVKLAREKGYRSRAAFKLIEILDQDRLLRPGMQVADLGAAPGSWCQVLRERLHGQGRVLALDLLAMDPIEGVEFIQGDFREQSVLDQLESLLGGTRLDLVVSDMAPNMSGIDDVDAARIADLCELALDFALHHLRPEGALFIKLFHGAGFDALVRQVKSCFVHVAVRKPKASRDRSAETYLLARHLKPGAARGGPPPDGGECHGA